MDDLKLKSIPLLVAACVLSVVLPVAGSANGEPETQRTERVSLAIDGQEAAQATLCGKDRTASQADYQQPVSAVVGIARPRNMTRAHVVVAGCQDGAWRTVRSQPFSPSQRYQLAIDTSLVGDYRLRALATDRRGRTHRSRFAYLRVSSPASLTARLEMSPPEVRPTYSLPWVFPGATMIRGELSSAVPECVADGRLLEVFRTDSGPERQVETGSSWNGEYEIYLGPMMSEQASGSYYVYAPRQGSCAEARSPVVSGE